MRNIPNAAPVLDDIGELDEPPGGGFAAGAVDEEADVQDRYLGETAVEDDGGVNTGGRTVTIRDFMAYYIFTRHFSSSKLSLKAQVP